MAFAAPAAERLLDPEVVHGHGKLAAADRDGRGAGGDDGAAIDAIGALDHLAEVHLHHGAGLRDGGRDQRQRGRDGGPHDAGTAHDGAPFRRQVTDTRAGVVERRQAVLA